MRESGRGEFGQGGDEVGWAGNGSRDGHGSNVSNSCGVLGNSGEGEGKPECLGEGKRDQGHGRNREIVKWLKKIANGWGGEEKKLERGEIRQGNLRVAINREMRGGRGVWRKIPTGRGGGC